MSSEYPTLSKTGLFPRPLLPQCSPTVASYSNQIPWGHPSIPSLRYLGLLSERTRIWWLTTTCVPTVAHLDYCNVLPKWAPPLVWPESRGQSEPVAVTSLLCSKTLSPAGKKPKPLKSPIRPRPTSRLPGTCQPPCSSLLRLSTSRTAVPSVNQAAPPHTHPLCCPSFISVSPSLPAWLETTTSTSSWHCFSPSLLCVSLILTVTQFTFYWFILLLSSSEINFTRAVIFSPV